MKAKKLFILWTSENKDNALNMLLMYSLKAQTAGWWDEIEIAAWGASNLLICSDYDVEIQIGEVKNSGVNFFACLRCAEKYGLVNQLESLGFTVKLMGEPLTERLQSDEWTVLTI